MEQGHLLSPGQARRPGLTPEDIARRLRSAPAGGRRSDVATARALAAAAEAGLAEAGTGEAGDGAPAAADPLSPPPPPDPLLVPAAVLVPLVAHPDGLTVLLTQRTAHLANHAGQISFPGGRMEESDATAVDAALRETEEEIGLSPRLVEVLGRLDDYVTVTGFRVVPVVGLVRPPFTLTPDPFEVAEVFEVPLDFLLDRRNHQRHHRAATPEGGRRRYYYAIPFGARYIWGATAGMLVNLWEVLNAPCAS